MDEGAAAAAVNGQKDDPAGKLPSYFSFHPSSLFPTGIVWISCEAELQHLSSSAIRELEAISPGAGARYVPSAAEVYGLGG